VIDDDIELSQLIKAQRHKAPAILTKRIDVALEALDVEAGKPREKAPKAERRHWFRPGFTITGGWAQLGVAFSFGLLVSLGVAVLVSHGRTEINRPETEVFDSHMRALMPGRSFDVASSDQHTVKPWFNGRLDFSPPVSDLANEGFPLAGGRLDYVNDHPAAALVYQRRRHVIDVYVWPSAQEAASVSPLRSHNGFNAYAWTDGGMQFWAISDIPAAELQTFVQQLRQKNAAIVAD
jgi:anti-sigma factor RsiW